MKQFKLLAAGAFLFLLLFMFPMSADAAGTKTDVATMSITVNSGSTYTGAPVTPGIVSVDGFVENRDYTLTYKNNVVPGNTAQVTVTGIGTSYEGTKTLYFSIADDPSIEAEVMIYPILPQYYTGKALTPDVHVFRDGTELIKDSQYTATYYDNTDAGNATVTVRYQGKVRSAQFQILPVMVSEDACEDIPQQPYNGMFSTPALKISKDGNALLEGTDYTATYMNNKEVGTAFVQVMMKGNYSGAFSKTL